MAWPWAPPGGALDWRPLVGQAGVDGRPCGMVSFPARPSCLVLCPSFPSGLTSQASLCCPLAVGPGRGPRVRVSFAFQRAPRATVTRS